ncbi:MAG: ATP-binding protein [Candidatus Choladocola sp.]|nr:ATP-binding protein [Candidatus Choladocola sp.]
MGLTNTQYNTIMRDYQRLQAQNRQELTRRTEEIYSRFPEFSEIDARIASASTSCARKLLTDGDASVDELRRQIAELSGYRSRLLREAGYPEDYLTPVYRCPDCHDTGYIGTEKCHCFRQATIDLLYMQSNLREILKSENFSTFSLKYYSDKITDPVTNLTAAQTARRTLEECRRFVKEFDNGFENLFLYGDTGLGKTFLSHCIAKELLDTTHSVIYFSSFRLFELFADSAFGRNGSSDQNDLEQYIFDCDFLIIDDLGTELVNSFVSSQLFLVLNERILRRRSTLISTNLALATFADTYSERIFSRISSNYTMLKLIGDDIRIQKKILSRKT